MPLHKSGKHATICGIYHMALCHVVNTTIFDIYIFVRLNGSCNFFSKNTILGFQTIWCFQVIRNQNLTDLQVEKSYGSTSSTLFSQVPHGFQSWNNSYKIAHLNKRAVISMTFSMIEWFLLTIITNSTTVQTVWSNCPSYGQCSLSTKGQISPEPILLFHSSRTHIK